MTQLSQMSRTILETYQVRKGKKRKAAFRTWLCQELRELGYSPRVESGGMSSNVVVGDPERASVIYTAHYDTCAVLPVPNFITPRSVLWYGLYQLLLVAAMLILAAAVEVCAILLWEGLSGSECPMWLAMGVLYVVLVFCMWWIMAGPANQHTVNDNTSGVLTLVEIAQAMPEHLRDHVCLVFFDNEEVGLLGSSAFAKTHKNVKKHTLVVNFDCVSDGDSIQFFPGKALKKKDTALLDKLEAAYPGRGEKDVEVVRTFGFYPSDSTQFKLGVGVCALKKSRIFGCYMDRIHTGRDTVLMEENIYLLRDGSIHLAQTLAAPTLTQEI